MDTAEIVDRVEDVIGDLRLAVDQFIANGNVDRLVTDLTTASYDLKAMDEDIHA